MRNDRFELFGVIEDEEGFDILGTMELAEGYLSIRQERTLDLDNNSKYSTLRCVVYG